MELWRVYRFTRFVKKKTNKDKDFALESFLITRFMETKHKWWIKKFTREDVEGIIKYGRKKDYLGAYQGSPGVKLKVAVPNGKDLIDFPLGTLQQFLSQYGLVVSFFTGSAFTGFVVLVWRMIWS